MAVDKHATTLHAFFDERNSCREVPDQTRLRGVVDVDDLVREILRKERLDPGGHLEDVSDAISLESRVVRCTLQVAEEKSLNDFIHINYTNEKPPRWGFGVLGIFH